MDPGHFGHFCVSGHVGQTGHFTDWTRWKTNERFRLAVGKTKDPRGSGTAGGKNAKTL